MKLTTKVTLFFMVFYLIWNTLLQNRLATVSEDRLDENLERIAIDTERLNESLIEEKKKIKTILRQTEQLSNSTSKKVSTIWTEPIPILVFVCSRADSLRVHLEKLIKYRPSKEQFPIIVSQDCDNTRVAEEAAKFGSEIEYIKHSPGETEIEKVPKKLKRFRAYFFIARHYKLALDHVFSIRNYSSILITEDDLDIAPDFFSYFLNTRYLLEKDKKLWCVSAWNDNGKPEFIDVYDNKKLYRSDFLPGLGWMMTRKTWEELAPKWPATYWDDWMREPEQRKGRHCIRPEISRTGMTEYGKKGVSNGQFFKTHLSKIKVNESPVDFSTINLDYLLIENYDEEIQKEVEKADFMDINDIISPSWKPENGQIRAKISYFNRNDFMKKAKSLGLMNDLKSSVPRTAYNGIVTCFYKNVRLFLVPARSKLAEYKLHRSDIYEVLE